MDFENGINKLGKSSIGKEVYIDFFDDKDHLHKNSDARHQTVWSTISRIDKNSITTFAKAKSIENKFLLKKVYAVFERNKNRSRGKLLYLNKQNLQKRGEQINNIYRRYNMHFLYGLASGMFIITLIAAVFRILRTIDSFVPATLSSLPIVLGGMMLLVALIFIGLFFDNLFHFPMYALWEKWEGEYYELLDLDDIKT